MQKTRFNKSLSFIVCLVLIAAMALFASGCSGNQTTAESSAPTAAQSYPDGAVLGEGATQFSFTVTDLEGAESSFTIQTDKETVGEALQDVGLIVGEAGPYGLYVKTVNGRTLDYDTDGKYWAFYENGQYAMAGVDMTEIDPSATYSFKAE